MKKGFTLIELLVVISIIAILTIITVSQFQTAQKKANDAARKGDLSALAKALEMYYADYGKFPTSNNGVIHVPTGTGKDMIWGKSFDDNAATPYVYMKVLPLEKKFAATFPYCYVTDGTGTKFGLFAMLENTADSQCDLLPADAAAYTHCGGKRYCFSYVSPNITVSDLSTYIK